MKKIILILFLLIPVIVNAEETFDIYDFNLSKGKAGLVAIGMTVDSLYYKYDQDSVKLVNFEMEGMFNPALEIYIPGNSEENASLVAEITDKNDWIIWRISVYDKRFQTKEGIRVGSTLGDLKKVYKDIRIGWAEGLYIISKSAGMSFGINAVGVEHGEDDMKKIPDTAEICEILIY